MNENIQIRTAKIEDIPGLLQLNGNWLRNNRNGDTSKGFISGAFDEQDFRDMIGDRMISVADDSNRVVAYMLSMNNAASDILTEHTEKAKEIRKNKTVDEQSRIAVGVQTAVEEQYHGTGLIVSVRKHFLKLLSDRFDYLFTTISKQNERSFKSATNFGWQVVGDSGEHYYLILKV
jgi:hypothetical protein